MAGTMCTKVSLICLVVALHLHIASQVLSVDLGVPEDFDTIQEAIDAARDGDTVLVAPGTYLLSRPIEINPSHDLLAAFPEPLKNIALRSTAGAEETILKLGQAESPDRASVIVVDKGESAETVIEASHSPAVEARWSARRCSWSAVAERLSSAPTRLSLAPYSR